MKTIAICVFLVFGHVWSLPTQSPRFSPFGRSVARRTCSGTGGEEFCSADCRSMVYCNAETPELTDCLTATGKPFCEEVGENIVSCTTDSSACMAADEKCPISDGEFPNVMDCTKFVYCIDGVPTDYECPPKFVYHGGERLCMYNIGCFDYNSYDGLCQGKVDERLRYPLNSKLFVYCTISGPRLRRCHGDDDNHINFDPISMACKFVCPGYGLYADPDDEEYFYECVRNGNGVYQETHRKCPEGSKYVEADKECQKTDVPPDSTVTYSTTEATTGFTTETNTPYY